MLGSLKTTVKDTLIYGFGNIAVKVVGLILIPIYTNPKYFTIDDFGIIGLLDISALLLTALLTVSLPQSFIRWYWDKDYVNNQKGIFFMALLSQIIVATLACLLLIPVSPFLSRTLFHDTSWSKVISLVILSSALQVINNMVNTLMRLQSRSTLYTFINILKLIIVLPLTLWLILGRHMGIEGIYLAQVIGNVLFILFLSGYTIRNCRLWFDRKVYRDMSIYGVPLFLSGVAAVLLNVIDRYSLNTWSVLKSVALYTLAFKISSVLKLVIVDSINKSILPAFLKKMDSPDNKRFYSKILLYTSYVVMFSIVGLSIFSYEITKVISISTKFWDAVIIIPVLALSVFFINMKEVMIYGLHIAKKTRIISLIVVGATILNLLLNMILIPVWDIKGAAAATLISQIFYWFACYYYAQKSFFIPYETRKLVVLFLTGAFLTFSGLFLSGLNLGPRLVIKSFLVIIFPFILYLFNFYDPIEIQSIKGLIMKWSNLKNLRSNINSLRNIHDDL